MEPYTITYAECPRSMSCREIDEWESSRELFESVRAAVDQSVSVRWHEEDLSVSVDWVVVGSVEEALLLTKEG